MVQISFIMPAFNVEDSLKKSVQGVLEQDIQDFEIIIINDGSTDRTKEVCLELEKTDPRIHSIHQKNGGPSAARNAGLNIAKGDYIAFVDGDDSVEPDMYSNLLQRMQAEDADIGICNVKRINQQEEKILNSGEFTSSDIAEVLHKYFVWNGVEFYVWNKLYRSHIFDTVRFPEGVLYEDVMLSYHALKEANRVTITEKVGYNYLDNPVSIVNRSFSPQQYNNVIQREILLNEVTTDFPTMRKYAIDNVLDGLLSTGFKLAMAKKDAVRKEYLDKLRQDIKKHQPVISKNEVSSKAKLMALTLLKTNINVYGFLYRVVLKK